jgi:hypothetical protein
VAASFQGVVADQRALRIRTSPKGLRPVAALCATVGPEAELREVTRPYREQLPMCASCAGPLMAAYQRETEWEL